MKAVLPVVFVLSRRRKAGALPPKFIVRVVEHDGKDNKAEFLCIILPSPRVLLHIDVWLVAVTNAS